VSKRFFTKKRQKIQNRFFRNLFNHVFGRFAVWGVQKHEEKKSHQSLTSPGIFLAFEEPTNHPKVRQLFFECPLEIGRVWWPEATRLEDPLDISNGTWTPKSSGERDGVLSLA
jgi:hypothetical protein